MKNYLNIMDLAEQAISLELVQETFVYKKK